jgi:hypothetical protein
MSVVAWLSLPPYTSFNGMCVDIVGRKLQDKEMEVYKVVW